jgi:Zn-dependent protease
MPFLFGSILFIGLILSIALHELGHSIVAKLFKCRVREITLMFMGGVAQMERITFKPMQEFLMALAGPAVSLLLAFIFIFIGNSISTPSIPAIPFNAIQHIGIINMGLAIFNLLPAFPMDGGRILRAILTKFQGRLKATRVAARIGKIFASLFGVAGVLIWRTDPFQAFIFAAIAVFIFTAARNEYQAVLAEEIVGRFAATQWPQWTDSPPTDDNSDKVLISPPPYSQGPGTETPVEHDEDNLFKYFTRK